jgi:DNA-binding transcriptional ArsR family regulator
MTDKSYDYCRAVSGKQRWPIVKLLHEYPDGLSVKDIIEKLKTNPTHGRIGHQLAILRDNKVVVSKRDRRESIYTLVDRKRVEVLLTV